MTLRSLAILVSVWAWILVPALCSAGVLAHGCPCEDESACEHESDCAADPCSEFAVRQHAPGWNADGSVGASIVLPDVPWTPSILSEPRRIPSAPRRARLPFPPSDLPLLI